MRITTIICGGILTAIAGSASACNLPKLRQPPSLAQPSGKQPEFRTAADAYFTSMQAYAACIQAELAGAGGDAAPDLVKRVLVSRNNAAVAEAEFMMKLYNENVGQIQGPPVGAPPPSR